MRDLGVFRLEGSILHCAGHDPNLGIFGSAKDLGLHRKNNKNDPVVFLITCWFNSIIGA